MDVDVRQAGGGRRTAPAGNHTGFRDPDRKGLGVPQPGKPDDLSLYPGTGRPRQAAIARRLFRRGGGVAICARQGDQGVQEREGIAALALRSRRPGISPPFALSGVQRSDSASNNVETTKTRCTATSQVILVASKDASMFKNASSTWIAEIATIEASSFCFSPAKSILVIHKGQFGLPDVSMRETKFS